MAVKKLPGGDLSLFLTNERTKATLLQDRSWTACFGKSCSIAENIYRVLVHSIRVDSVNPRRAEDVAKLQEESQALYDGLKITRLSWLNRGHAPGKTHGSLIVGVATEQMANWIIRRGLVSNFAIHLAEYYNPHAMLQMPSLWPRRAGRPQGRSLRILCWKAQHKRLCDAITAQVRQLWKETPSLESRM